jgi:hypothetical protein
MPFTRLVAAAVPSKRMLVAPRARLRRGFGMASTVASEKSEMRCRTIANKGKTMPSREATVAAVIGALVGAVATPLIGGTILLSSSLSDVILDRLSDNILSRLQVDIVQGEYYGGSDLTAKCPREEKLIGGICYVRGGSASLQNAGVSKRENGEWNYICDYADITPKAILHVWAACLKWNK